MKGLVLKKQSLESGPTVRHCEVILQEEVPSVEPLDFDQGLGIACYALPRTIAPGGDVDLPQASLSVRLIGLTQDRAPSGKTSVKVDITTMHGFEVQLAPRTNARPGVERGSLGGAGECRLPGLDIPIQGDRGYLLEAWVRAWVGGSGDPPTTCQRQHRHDPRGTRRHVPTVIG